MIKDADLAQEMKDNKSHCLVTLLDFADIMKNQTKDSYYRSRIDGVLVDVSDLRGALVKLNNAELVKQLDMIISDLTKFKKETQLDIRGELLDYHKVGIEYLKKRIHCDINNYYRRICLSLGLPLEKHRIEEFKDKD